jgi:exodeoxyribonuclease-3
MKLASWNVNSLRVRLPHVLDWLGSARPSVLAIQETKLTDDKFPRPELEAAGYHVVIAGQPTYNGVALLVDATAFQAPNQLQINNPLFPDDQIRLITATLTPVTQGTAIRVICAYVPNGSEVGSEKYAYKLRWLDALAAWVCAEEKSHSALAVMGDFNIAPEDRDVYDPEAWREKVLCSSAERERLRALCACGLTDAFRLTEQPENLYSWWDYREAAFRRNRGLRIDLILLSQTLADACRASGVDTEPRKLERPSDHAPVWVECVLE